MHSWLMHDHMDFQYFLDFLKCQYEALLLQVAHAQPPRECERQ